MVVTDKLKQIVFKRLYKELGNAEIIPYTNSIWFIDREKEYWYFELDKSGTLWWRYHFFTSFFEMFSMTANDFTPILSSWVEEVLNHKVTSTDSVTWQYFENLEEVLNHKVDTTWHIKSKKQLWVEEVLNHKVVETQTCNAPPLSFVKDILNYKVKQTKRDSSVDWVNVEEVLNQ